ncbi:hypothetical protein AVEN_217877-1 [Araneus ventricosus]|uniref:Uncharacterized protein n=1 Tax=Araneus ventricosus TaxID=182803 RepID=A0A4Y2RP60_ARAVE|nr:hypothetical protein AVEN_217877-1 [Araneus ventricosus]
MPFQNKKEIADYHENSDRPHNAQMAHNLPRIAAFPLKLRNLRESPGSLGRLRQVSAQNLIFSTWCQVRYCRGPPDDYLETPCTSDWMFSVRLPAEPPAWTGEYLLTS